MSATEFLDFGDVKSDDDIKGGQHYPDEGQYHLVITNVDDTRTKCEGAMVIEVQVLAGTVPGQEGKKFKENFWDPSPSHKDQGKFAKGKLARLIIATGLATKDELFGKRLQINWDDLTFRTLKAAVVHRTSKGVDKKTQKEREYLNAQFDGLDFWGPCDPDAEHIPADPEANDLAFEAGQLNAKPPKKSEEQAGTQDAAATAAATKSPAKEAATEAPAQRATGKAKAADPYAGL